MPSERLRSPAASSAGCSQAAPSLGASSCHSPDRGDGRFRTPHPRSQEAPLWSLRCRPGTVLRRDLRLSPQQLLQWVVLLFPFYKEGSGGVKCLAGGCAINKWWGWDLKLGPPESTARPICIMLALLCVALISKWAST